MRDLIVELAWAAKRALRRPGFFVLAVSLLAIGSGSALVVASLYEQIVLLKLPVARPDELLLVQKMTVSATGEAQPYGRFSREECADLRKGSAEALELACFVSGRPVAGFAAGAERAAAEWVSGSYFSLLGVHAALGRLVEPSDDEASANATVVLSHAAWSRRFGMDPGVLGRSIEIDGRPSVVIGVAPRGFHGTEVGGAPELYLPSVSAPPEEAQFRAAARLLHGTTAARAGAILRAIHAGLLAAHPERQSFMIVDGKTSRVTERVDVRPGARGDSELRGGFARTLALALGMIGLVLLILCVNFANLLAARAADERRQNAVRRALGATRGRLAWSAICESLLLCLTGGGVGLWLASLCAPLLVRALPEVGGGDAIQFEISPAVALLTLALGFATSLVVGGLAAWEASRASVADVLRGGGPTATSERARTSWRWSLVAVQVALSLVLLVAMGLLTRSLDALLAIDTGLPLDRVLTFRVDLPPSGARGPGLQISGLREKLSALPGVVEAAYATVPLLGGARSFNMVSVEGYRAADGEAMMLNTVPVSPGFFEALGLRTLRGRTYARDEAGGAPSHSIVVNRRFVERYLGSIDPLGRRISFQMKRDWSHSGAGDLEIVGIVADGATADVREAAVPRIYPLVGPDERSVLFYVRTAGAPASLVAGVRALLRELAPEAALGEVRSLESQRAILLGAEQRLSRFSLTVGLLAALITAVGLYGVIRLAVARRARDFAVRIALGAGRAHIVRMVSRDALRAVLTGLVVGAVATIPATRLLASFLYGVKPADPLAFAAAIVGSLLVAAAAAWFPVRRALRTDPAAALRQE